MKRVCETTFVIETAIEPTDTWDGDVTDVPLGNFNLYLMAGEAKITYRKTVCKRGRSSRKK